MQRALRALCSEFAGRGGRIGRNAVARQMGRRMAAGGEDPIAQEVDVIVRDTRHGPIAERRAIGGEARRTFDASDLRVLERTLGARMSAHGSLFHIKLARCGLVRCPAGAFTSSTLQTLDVSGNRLADIDRLEGTRFPALVRLDASGNRLARLPGPAFWAAVPRLAALHLAANDLTDAGVAAADPLPSSLRDVSLDGNARITRIPPALARLESLAVLRAARCCITRLPRAASWPALHSLDVAENRIAAVPDWLLALPALRRLNLSHNPLGRTPDVPPGLHGARRPAPRPRDLEIVDLRATGAGDATDLALWAHPATVILDDEFESAVVERHRFDSDDGQASTPLTP